MTPNVENTTIFIRVQDGGLSFKTAANILISLVLFNNKINLSIHINPKDLHRVTKRIKIFRIVLE